ncbi:hypothetical protein PFISCL1PPCAC_22272, partial [Pristionchus fissidentatus]
LSLVDHWQRMVLVGQRTRLDSRDEQRPNQSQSGRAFYSCSMKCPQTPVPPRVPCTLCSLTSPDTGPMMKRPEELEMYTEELLYLT